MKNHKAAVSGTIGVTILMGLPLWFLSYPQTTFQHNIKPLFIYSSQIIGIVGFCLFALSFMFALRSSWLENIFGGLDKVYYIHHLIGKIAFFLLLLHPVLLAFRWIPEDITKALMYLLPLHRRLAINLGSWALWGLTILILFTLVIKIAYNRWKVTHKFMGLFFMVGILHIFLLDDLMVNNLLLAIYLAVFALLGTVSYLYRTLFYQWFSQKSSYTVNSVERLTDRVIQITLAPDGPPLKFKPGQFCFFSFDSQDLSRESHPYTICSVPNSNNIRIIVKALGDYTTQLYKYLRIDVTAHLEGPFGRFEYKKNQASSQVWIGGGVGIAPFISWTEDLLQSDNIAEPEVDLYFCINTRSEAILIHKFQEAEKTLRQFYFHLICADQQGFLDITNIPQIQNREIFICGPKEMRQNLLQDLKKVHIPGDKIHYEDFDFI